MKRLYTISTEVHFSASHSLRGYDGGCARVHGHNWVLRVYYEFTSLDSSGLTIDYGLLKEMVEKVIMPVFDHRHINDIEPFDRINPTSENIAAEIFRMCKEKISFPNGELMVVELWETPTDMVRYSEEEE